MSMRVTRSRALEENLTIKIEVNEVEDRPGDGGDDKPLQSDTVEVVVKQEIEVDDFSNDPEEFGNSDPDYVYTSKSTSKDAKANPKSYNKPRSLMSLHELEKARMYERNRREKLRQEKLRLNPKEVKVKLRDRLTPEEWRERRKAIRKKHYEKLMATPESREAWYQFRRQYLREQRQKKKQKKLHKQAEAEQGQSQEEKGKVKGKSMSSSATKMSEEEKRERRNFQQMVYRINKATSEEWKEKERQRWRNYETTLTPEQFKARREMMRESKKKYGAKMRQYWRTNETPEQKKVRLRKTWVSENKSKLKKNLRQRGFAEDEIQLRLAVFMENMDVEKSGLDFYQLTRRGRPAKGQGQRQNPFLAFLDSLQNPDIKFTLSLPNPTQNLHEAEPNDHDDPPLTASATSDPELEDFRNSYFVPETLDDLDEVSHVCSECSSKFISEVDLQTHIKLIHIQNCFGCPACPELFETLEKFQSHCNESHNEVVTIKVKVEPEDVKPEPDELAKTRATTSKQPKRKWTKPPKNETPEQRKARRRAMTLECNRKYHQRNQQRIKDRQKFLRVVKKIQSQVEVEANGDGAEGQVNIQTKMKRLKKTMTEEEKSHARRENALWFRKFRLRKKLEKKGVAKAEIECRLAELLEQWKNEPVRPSHRRPRPTETKKIDPKKWKNYTIHPVTGEMISRRKLMDPEARRQLDRRNKARRTPEQRERYRLKNIQYCRMRRERNKAMENAKKQSENRKH